MWFAARRRRGFTLIELLAVIAIITILASLALGGINVARKRARIAGSKAEVKNLALAVDQFSDDFGYYPPSWRESVLQLVSAPTPSATPVPTPRPWNFVDDETLDGLATAIRPATASARSAKYDENGIELLVLYLSTDSKNGPYLDTDTARTTNQDNDRVTSNGALFNAVFSKEVSPGRYSTELYEWTDLWGRPLVYVRYDRYNPYNAYKDFDDTWPNLDTLQDGDTDGNSDVDGKPVTTGKNEYRRVTPLDPKTADSFRRDSYILYSLGPNGLDNLGYNDDQNRMDDDGNGVIDDEDDITVW